MNKSLILIVLIMIVASCKNVTGKKTSHAVNAIAEEVSSLSTIELQKEYLEQIGDLDQRVRIEEDETIIKYGYNSEVHKTALDRIRAADKLNLEKTEKYLEIYGYPNLRDHGRIAVDIPWTILQHSDDIEAMRRNFKYIYKAHSEDYQLRDIAFTTFLNHMYQMEFGNQIAWNRPFKVDEEIDTLMKALNLEEIKN
jgi:hypothetical protein